MSVLRELRKQEKLTQAELGELLGVSQRSYANYELGLFRIPPDIAERIRDAFNLTTEQMWEILYRSA